MSLLLVDRQHLAIRGRWGMWCLRRIFGEAAGTCHGRGRSPQGGLWGLGDITFFTSLVKAMPLASMWKMLSAERLVYKPTKLKSDPGI